jgi:Domain of unknown function (DUF5615)
LTGSLRFLLDENVRAASCGALDRDVLGEAARSGRILVTLDTDYGTLVFLRRRRPPPAVVLIRLPPAELLPRLEAVVAAIEQHAAGTGGSSCSTDDGSASGHCPEPVPVWPAREFLIPSARQRGSRRSRALG